MHYSGNVTFNYIENACGLPSSEPTVKPDYIIQTSSWGQEASVGFSLHLTGSTAIHPPACAPLLASGTLTQLTAYLTFDPLGQSAASASDMYVLVNATSGDATGY